MTLTKYIKTDKGFTLIEMLLVLFIVIVVSSFVYKISLTITEKQVINQFFNQVQLDIQSMQALAIEEKKTINVLFSDNNTYKAYYSLDGKKIFERSFPTNIQLNIYSNLKNIVIYPNGEVVNFGKIIFYTPFGERQLIVNIQKGRMRIVEAK
ncbi:type II secretion system protein [Ureibacillus sp. Re31]|uniref:Type II secretion system protein n=1 Tax=Ureibacillus galli TaxID=2762222 RepID=A0ABR8X9U6_9BACL|nr:competence type IV pilus minor pilin ComGD [Ureibacillus galli]MBD8026080.1 type II secretion system protein [Ureibacillus galli]